MAGNWILYFYVALFTGVGITAVAFRQGLKARKIQPRGFAWKTFRTELFLASVNLLVTGLVITTVTSSLQTGGWIAYRLVAGSWWDIALEYALYFFLFDAYFYWAHRLMHQEPWYRLIHKVHHWSTCPNIVTPMSMNPIEAILEGMFVPIFLTVFTVHQETLYLILPTNILLGVYVHSGYELFPRWWNKSWATKWFITATFHDQHHKYFLGNYGGYTTIWDRLCGTMRPRFEADFDRITDRRSEREPGQPEPA